MIISLHYYLSSTTSTSSSTTSLPCFFLVIFLFFINNTYYIQPSLALYQGYIDCKNSNYSCGQLRNIGYPFWGDGRPVSCGHPQFKLFCPSGSNYPFIQMGKQQLPYQVLNISTSARTMVLVNPLFAYENTTCPPSFISTSVNEPFFAIDSNGSSTANLTIFYGCPRRSYNRNSNSSGAGLNDNEYLSSGILSNFSCNYNGSLTTSLVYEGEEGNSSSSGPGSGGCNASVFVPVFRSGIVRIKSALLEVLKLGFEVEYRVDVGGACSACVESGGICGSSSSSSLEFSCLCSDGAYPSVCLKSSSSGTRRISTAAKIGVSASVIGAIVLVSALLLFFYIRRRGIRKIQHKKKHPSSSSGSNFIISRNVQSGTATTKSLSAGIVKGGGGGEVYMMGVHLFTYEELQEATDYFDPSRELGTGGFGTVYHGKLRDGRDVAIKRLYENNSRRVQQFMNEIEILARLRHTNLVTLYGCTPHNSREPLLVYEYVANGTVADHIHVRTRSTGTGASNSNSLSWPVRLNIAVETASALVYLHASDIVHRDVKTTNILLDSNFSVKVADFGLSRLFPLDVTHVSTAPQGTPGYVDPEYHHCYHLTDKSDVYSFGVVLVELISSLPAVDITRNRHEINLSSLALNKIRDGALVELVDPDIGFEVDVKVEKEVMSVGEVAFRCLQHERDMRPTMEEVLEELRVIQNRRRHSSDHQQQQKQNDHDHDVDQISTSSTSSSSNSTSRTSYKKGCQLLTLKMIDEQQSDGSPTFSSPGSKAVKSEITSRSSSSG